MNGLVLILDFAMKALPFVFKDKGFEPKKFAALIVMILLSAGIYHFFGAEGSEVIIENAEALQDISQ